MISIKLLIALIIIGVIIIILYLQIKQYTYISPNLEILQINEITKDNLENLCRTNQPIVINRFPQDIKCNLNQKIKVVTTDQYINGNKKYILLDKFSLNQNKKQFLVDIDARKIINTDFLDLITNYHSPLSNKTSNSITVFNPSFFRNLTKTGISRNIYICVKGECIFRLYHPKHVKHTKFVNKSTSHYQLLPNNDVSIKKSQFIEIIIRESQGLIIPRYWTFTYHCRNGNCILLNSKSFDFIGFFAQYF